MRKYHLIGLGFVFSIFSIYVSFASAASISGTVSYGGSQTGSIIVAAFNSPLTCSGPYAADPNPYSLVELETIGDYTISDLPDGTYYLASVIFTDGLEGDLQATDPWAIYGCGDTPAQVVISGGKPETGKDMTLVDGTVDVPNPFYSTYYIIAHSAHDPWGYWMEIFVDDSSHNATAVTVTGPGISGETASLEYNSSEGRWDSSNTGKLAFTETPMTLPLTYFIDITDSSGTTLHEVVIQGYVEVFATNLSPDGNQVVTGNPVFSWTGVEGDYTFEIRLDSSNWHKNNLTETSIVYDGPPLIPGTNYEWHVNVFDQYNNVAYSFANFVYQATPQISLGNAINYLKIIVSKPETIPPETLIDVNSDQKVGLEEVLYVLQVTSGLKPQPVCGNGIVDFNEQCDDGNQNDGDACTSSCTIIYRTVFLTSSTYTGNLGGLAGADAKCNDLASAAGLPGTYKAWLSDESSSPADRFTHHGQFVLVNSAPVAESWSDLTDATIINPINVDENGNTSPEEYRYVWSNTHWNGSIDVYTVDTCSYWTTDSSAERGSGAYPEFNDYQWSRPAFTNLCDSTIFRMYCFEQ